MSRPSTIMQAHGAVGGVRGWLEDRNVEMDK